MATKIIAEAGVNHNGSLDLALKLVEEAKLSGANSIKFQTFKSESLASFSAPLAQYQKESNSYKSQVDMLKSLELTDKDTKRIFSFCNEIGIEFMSSPFGVDELHFLLDLGMLSIKIPSGEITNHALISEIGKSIKEENRSAFLSTGMSSLGDIEKALSLLNIRENLDRITIMHCVSSYPAPNKDLNLKVLGTLQNCFSCKIGYSDHSENIIAPIISTALGASVIEKHLTLDKDLPGPDHKASITPKLFAKMVSDIRATEVMLGNGRKETKQSEIENKLIARRSIRALNNIKKGTLITKKNIIFQRPGNGLSPMEIDKVIGAIASKNYKDGDVISDLNLNEI